MLLFTHGKNYQNPHSSNPFNRHKTNNMNINLQVCSLEQAKRLKELGVYQWGYFSFFDDGRLFISPTVNEHDYGDPIASAFTVAELGVMLNEPTLGTNNEGDLIETNPFASIPEEGEGLYDTEAEARAAALIYFLETGNIELGSCNDRLIS